MQSKVGSLENKNVCNFFSQMNVTKIPAKCYIPQETQNPNLSLNAFSNQATGAVVVNFPRVLEMIITLCIRHHFFHYHCYLSFSMQKKGVPKNPTWCFTFFSGLFASCSQHSLVVVGHPLNKVGNP